MVTALHGDLYIPFPHSQLIEEGFQSSEEGSDLQSPIFEVPYPQDGAFALSNPRNHSVFTWGRPTTKKPDITLVTSLFPTLPLRPMLLPLTRVMI